MKMSILGIEYKNIRKITDLKLSFVDVAGKYSLQGTTQGRYLTGGVPPVRFSM